MSRSECLLHLLQVLRRYRRPVRGQTLAEELGVSIRTLYRDIASLQAQGARSKEQGAMIEGEPGVGFGVDVTVLLLHWNLSVLHETSEATNIVGPCRDKNVFDLVRVDRRLRYCF
ncbi:hypothetical protein LMG22931_05047 [Paraburkholderia nemoris]|nr:hypothetical protein LMG22931_05047 [Paraburkholderia nemoris]